MIELKKLKDLVELMVTNDLTELDLQSKDERVTVKRGSQEPVVQYMASAANPAAAQSGVATPQAAQGSNSDGESTGSGDQVDDKLKNIMSPMVGTFYAASSPDAKPFVSVGDRVEPDTVVCIVEAMKVFNEIRAELSGTIAEVLVETGQAVEFGQPLFRVNPG